MGKRVLITGATSGIGREAAKQMLQQGASLIMTARDATKGRSVAEVIAKEAGTEPPEVVECDTSSSRSIRAAADQVRKNHDKLDVLVNNAGIQRPTRCVTRDGLEEVFATNVLGYFLLTQELLPLLKAAAPSRIVVVASTYAGELDLDDLEFNRRPWNNTKSYKQTKQANRMWSWALARRLEGSGVTINAMSPGLVDTGLYREMKGFQRLMMMVLSRLFGRPVTKGADTVVWLALSKDVEGVTNKFWTDRQEKTCEFRNEPDEERLWKACEQLITQGA